MSDPNVTWPRPIREIENTWIPMSDGARLAARIWLPQDADERPVPAILEYLPYRKGDSTAFRDATRHPYFAGHGYAAVRVDMRGSGDSDGILRGEYLPQEQEDGLEVLAWLAEQPWCSGRVGIIGISWGGFNGLQIAARQPAQLGAVITLCSTDDRYADDVHYMGGCLLGIEMLPWATTMLAYNGRPPDPRVVGERWRDMWLARLAQTPPFIADWLAHQRRDAFWEQGSVCQEYGAITCPVYAVGGWADGYTNSIPRLLAGLSGPRKGLIGPWGHTYPEQGRPGPAIGFLQECLRWWDYWLKDIDTGIMDEPMLRVWLQEHQPPAAAHATWPGRWVAEPSWPPSQAASQTWWLADDALVPAPPAGAPAWPIRGDQTAGRHAGIWCPTGAAGDFPPDQRHEDGLALCFTSPPLKQRIEILGFPTLKLHVAATAPLALLAARLCAVAPDGRSTLVTRGLLNLTHRHGHDRPAPLPPDSVAPVTVTLNAIGYALPAGHRWRLALSPTYWPHAWPSPTPVTLRVHGGAGSQLQLPVRTPRPADAALRPFAPPAGAPPLPADVLRPAQRRWRETEVPVTGLLRLVDHQDYGRRRIRGNGLIYDAVATDTYSVHAHDPLSAAVACRRRIGIERGDWQTRVTARSRLTATADAFLVTCQLEAHEGARRVFAHTWTFNIARDLV